MFPPNTPWEISATEVKDVEQGKFPDVRRRFLCSGPTMAPMRRVVNDLPVNAREGKEWNRGRRSRSVIGCRA